MTDNNILELKLQEISKDVGELTSKVQAQELTLAQLNITISLLDQTVKTMSSLQEERKQFMNRVQFFVIGGFISALVAFIIGGGLVL